VRENGVVPTGLWVFFIPYPALNALGYPVPRPRRSIPAAQRLLVLLGNRSLAHAL